MSWAAVLLLAALARSHWHRIDTKEGSIAICVTIYLADLGQANHRAGRSLGLQHWSRAALAMYVCVCVCVCLCVQARRQMGATWAPLGRQWCSSRRATISDRLGDHLGARRELLTSCAPEQSYLSSQ